VEGTASATGEAFYEALVRETARALGVQYVLLAELLELGTRVRTLACWWEGALRDNLEYELSGTPCEVVARGNDVYHTNGTYRLFPGDAEIVRLRIESYFGVPLQDVAGVQIGHLAVFHTQPLEQEFRCMALLRIFAARAAGELRREHAARALRVTEERLSGILRNALDPIVVAEDDQRISFFNAAAERTFRCRSEDVLGGPVERLFSRHMRNLFAGYCMAIEPAAIGHRQSWAPAETLTARRLNGEEFPVDLTITPAKLEGRWRYTLILSDRSERQRAEQALNRLKQENAYLQESVCGSENFGEVLGVSGCMRELFAQVERVAGTDSTVLLTGETGTGKGAIARAVHERSRRCDRLLVTVNCAALPSELVESELFGHEKGAFTSASAQRKGRFELADGGTLFLDEVGELPLGTQAKLLRVLQDREFERVGGSRSIKVDVRLIAATNRDLGRMVRDGRFRSDLFYRLNVFPVSVPPLRERREDISLLASHFLRELATRVGRPDIALSPAALKRLTTYAWPGNVRELQNVLERAVILASGPQVEVEEALDLRLDAAPEDFASGTLEQMERDYIVKVLNDTGWLVEGARGAASRLGLKPSTLRSRIAKLKIRRSSAA
jgi:PAS domain S-box-containing protein